MQTITEFGLIEGLRQRNFGVGNQQKYTVKRSFARFGCGRSFSLCAHCVLEVIFQSNPPHSSQAKPSAAPMIYQKHFQLPALRRGFHLITEQVLRELPELPRLRAGLLHVFIHHTSASLSINENADPTVRHDFEQFFSRLAPENAPYFRHISEGPDDMPAHLKAALLGSSVSIPVANGRLALGTWQGIYLGEHREHVGRRSLMLTLMGE
jgi:secondary thiamine-phosphate synthase enzyme